MVMVRLPTITSKTAIWRTTGIQGTHPTYENMEDLWDSRNSPKILKYGGPLEFTELTQHIRRK